MRLLLLSSEFPPGPGGIGTHAYELARNLVNEGWQVAVITPQDYTTDAEIRAFNKDQPFELIPLASRRGLPRQFSYRWRVASQHIKSWRPDVLVATGSRQVWLGAALAWYHRKPWMAVGHGTEYGFTSGWEKTITRWAFQQADIVVCVSEFTRQYMLDVGIRPRRDYVIPNGADIGRFKRLSQDEIAAFREKQGLPEGALLLTVGNVTERKGQDVVIRALPHVLKQVPDVHYLIAGLPTKQEEFSRLARELGVADHVHFLGRVDSDSIVAYMNTCDVFVMTSKHTATGDFEGYGIAVVEAALCGKPAVVSANSGLAEAIIDEETGFLASQNDETATAQAILKLLTDDERRTRMGEAAYQRAVNEQTWAHRVHEYHKLLGELARGTSPAVQNAMESKSL